MLLHTQTNLVLSNSVFVDEGPVGTQIRQENFEVGGLGSRDPLYLEVYPGELLVAIGLDLGFVQNVIVGRSLA